MEYCRAACLYLLGVEVLGPAEHVALGEALTAELVDLHHLAEGDQSDERVGRQQAQRHLQRLLQQPRAPNPIRQTWLMPCQFQTLARLTILRAVPLFAG